jgi:uncharacterized protein (TIGR03067 family)
MRSLAIVAALGLLPAGPPALDRPLPLSLAEEDGEAKARKELVGTWKGFAVEGKGETPDRGPVKLELRISERTIKGLELKGGKVVDHGEGTYVLDLTKSPRHLDASKTNERGRKEEYVGIYSVEGDTLKWCVSRRKTRPTDFQTGDGGYLLILRRQAETR